MPDCDKSQIRIHHQHLSVAFSLFLRIIKAENRKTNYVLNTLQNCLCVSCPRRFGKSMAATMLAVYYSRECDSKVITEKRKNMNA